MKKVLVVDDAAFIRMQLKQLLIKNNYDVVGEAENGKVALDKIRSLKPDIVTLDITMPVMDGIECLEEINKMENKPSVIMVTALGQEDYVRKAVLNGAKGFIIKPYKPEVAIKQMGRL